MTIRFALVFAFILSLTSNAILGQDPDGEPAQEMEAEEVQEAIVGVEFDPANRIEQAVAKELERLQKITKLSDETIAGLKLGAMPLIKAETKKAGQTFSMTNALSPGLLTAIASAAESVVTDKKLYAVYREDVDLRLNFEQQAAVYSFTEYLDVLVGLTMTQRSTCSKLAEELFAKEQISGSMLYAPQLQISEGLKPEDLKSLLTDKQLKYFQEFSSQPTVAVMPGQSDEVSPEKRREELTQLLRSVAAMKVDQLDSELKLSATQRRKLELVGKGIISKAVSARLDAELAYKKYIEGSMLGNGPGDQPDMEMISLATAGAVPLFEMKADRWAKFVNSTLNEQQRAAWKKIEETRSQSARRSLSYTLVKQLEFQMQLSGKQQVATQKLLLPNLGPVKAVDPNGLGMMEAYAGLLNIPEGDYIKALGDENWQIFKPGLAQLRQRLEAMKKNEADDE